MPGSAPPSATEVFDRVWALTIVVRVAVELPVPAELRAALAAMPVGDRKEVEHRGETQISSLREQLDANGALVHLTERERTFLFTPAHAVPDDEWMLAITRLEALRTLAWSLGALPDLPPFDADPSTAVLDALQGTDGTLSLRPREEIERMRELAGLWFWRSRTRALRDGLWPLPAGVTHAQLDDAVRDAAAGAVADGMIASAIDGDLPAKGKAYRALGAAEWRQVSTTTNQRLHALNWLCGRAPENDWERTPLEV
ncbi:MAG TPA: DUF4272 domain-containing protein [Gemmatimonadaceae bacterium]|nr:DUF4272 domain-containing protein [Gemmatimonadaceae bacterium]